MKIKKLKLLILITIFIFMTTGCTKDDMEGIDITVTNYPNEYIINELYGEHATISSIYPDGVEINNYKINKKQKKDYSKNDLFIYNGLIEKERNLAIDMLDLNQDLKIIDSAYVLETEYSPEELWLNPSSMLMMAQNIRLGLKEYVSSTYLQKEIDNNYEELKITLSELDADYRVAVENTNNKSIVVADSTLKYLEKFGVDILCIDNDTTEKTITEIETLIKNGTISYIYTFKDDELNTNASELLKKYPDIKKQELHKLDNLSDSDRENKKDYMSIMNENLELLKQELYQ